MKGNEIKEADRKRWEKAWKIPAVCSLCGEIMLFQKETYKPEELVGYECTNCKMLMHLFGRDV